MAGGAGLGFTLPVTLAIAALLAVLVASYRQVIAGFPGGGGAYAVARTRLGRRSSLTAAASLIIDYVLNVAVSIAAGVAALTSAFPALLPYTVWIALVILVGITALNLRGIADSARAFMVPTIVFVASIVTVIVAGLLLLLKAFSSGCAALTGVEAIANAVPSFKTPRVVQAQRAEVALGRRHFHRQHLAPRVAQRRRRTDHRHTAAREGPRRSRPPRRPGRAGRHDPEALRRRMAHGNVYPPETVGAALGNNFRVGNLTALRELAMLWLADKVDDQLDRYRADHYITGTWEAREWVVVGLTGGPEGETLIRRAARIADRSKGADLFAVHITPSDGLAGASPAHLARQRALVESLGGTFHHVVGDDVPGALLEFARGINATQLVIGASRRGRLAQIFSRGVGVEVTALPGSIDVHMVTHEATSRGRAARLSALTRRRRVIGFVIALVRMPLLSIALANLRGQLSLPSDILIFLIGVVGVALVGGLWSALLAALLGSALLNYYFTPPLYTFTIAANPSPSADFPEPTAH